MHQKQPMMDFDLSPEYLVACVAFIYIYVRIECIKIRVCYLIYFSDGFKICALIYPYSIIDVLCT